MSWEKVRKGFKRGGLAGAIGGIEVNNVRKAAEKADEIGDAASRGGKLAIEAAKRAKAGIDQYRVERAQRAAKVKTEVAQHKIRSYESILKTRVEEDCKRDWATLLEDVFSGSPPPSLKEAKVAVGVPRRHPINAVRKGERGIRSAKDAEARKLHQKLVREYDETVSQAKLELARLKARYDKGDAEAIEFYVRGVLRRSAYPEGVQPELDVSLDPSEKTVVVDFVV